MASSKSFQKAPITQDVSKYIAKHDTTKFQLSSKTHWASIYVHHKGGDLGKLPSFPRILESLPSFMSAEQTLVTCGLSTLSELHSQYPLADSSFIEIWKKGQSRGGMSTLALEAKRWSADESKRPRLTILYQSYSHLDGVNIARDNQFFWATIEIKETFVPMARGGTIHPQYFPWSVKSFGEKPMLSVLKTSHQELAKSINEDGSPMNHSIARLAARVFELVDEVSPQNQVTDVLVSLKTSKSQERLRYAMTRKAFKEKVGSISLKSEDAAMKALRHTAFIALGSNVGDRIAMLEAACALMKVEGIQVQRTSALYETTPMYLEDQERFINGVCQISTTLSPQQLLARLQAVEQKLGRVKSVDNGPRSVDLDILLYDDVSIKESNLVIPHERMTERAFVIRPLCDIAASEWRYKVDRLVRPSFFAKPSFRELLPHLSKRQGRLFPITRISPSRPNLVSELPTRKTHLMAILNLTPDSFSDGGTHGSAPSTLLNTLRAFVRDGATIIDVGGQSSRPGAMEISAEEEASRILPTIKLMRFNHEFDEIMISVDTYRASVAQAAVEAGAHIVNDISAGLMDPEMLSTVASLGCTVILGHMRGTPLTMTKLIDYGPSVSQQVGVELLARFRAAEEAGIYRWRIILDPGIGFAKNEQQNLEILRGFKKLRETEGLKGLPWCVGSSRKGFIGRITGVDVPKERVVGSVMCVAAAIQGGAEIVRVHDVKETTEAIKMADAIWRAEEDQDGQINPSRRESRSLSSSDPQEHSSLPEQQLDLQERLDFPDSPLRVKQDQ